MSLDLYRHRGELGAAPTLVLLHGTGGTASEMIALGRRLAPGAALLAPEGDVDENGQARFFRRLAEGVYDMADLAARSARLDAFLAAAAGGGGLRGFGYSNGANMLAQLLFLGSARFSRVVLARPLIPFEPPAVDLSATSALLLGGRRDPIAPPEATERLAASLVARGARVETRIAPGGHGLGPDDVAAAAAFLTAGDA